jgi:hypothetical protein
VTGVFFAQAAGLAAFYFIGGKSIVPLDEVHSCPQNSAWFGSVRS